jgi:F0F1-type ATP synthase delta subunit
MDKQNNGVANQVMKQLDEFTLHLPIDQIMGELQVIIERLSFSELHQVLPGSRDQDKLSEIELLLKDDISPEVLGFVKWMAQQNLMRLLGGKGGRLFLSYCSVHYRKVQQVRFVTAVDIGEAARHSIVNKLRVIYPEPTRIIFEVETSLLAGCLIDDGQRRSDMSLQTNLASTLAERVAGRAYANGAVNG